MNSSGSDPDRADGSHDSREAYAPIECGLHDVLESLATRREACVIRHDETPDGGEVVTSGVIEDVFSRSGAEFLRMSDGETIRLDRIQSLETADDTIAFE